MKFVIQLVIVLLLSGCTHTRDASEIVLSEVRSALVVYILDSRFDSIDKIDHIFLSFDGSDPSNEFIENFKEVGVNIHPVSESKYDETQGTVAHVLKIWFGGNYSDTRYKHS